LRFLRLSFFVTLPSDKSRHRDDRSWRGTYRLRLVGVGRRVHRSANPSHERVIHAQTETAVTGFCAATADSVLSIWCSTRRTEDWHVVSTPASSCHLHVRSTKYRRGVRFEEVAVREQHTIERSWRIARQTTITGVA